MLRASAGPVSSHAAPLPALPPGGARGTAPLRQVTPVPRPGGSPQKLLPALSRSRFPRGSLSIPLRCSTPPGAAVIPRSPAGEPVPSAAPIPQPWHRGLCIEPIQTTRNLPPRGERGEGESSPFAPFSRAEPAAAPRPLAFPAGRAVRRPARLRPRHAL